MSKSTGEPKLRLLNKQSSDAHTGTTIRIDLRSKADFDKFSEECKSQLRYFDNVYVNNIEPLRFENNYTVFEGDYFKYRRLNIVNHMHVVIQNVWYPLQDHFFDYEVMRLPFALKFDIGELEVTPNREQLVYTDAAKTLIHERWQLLRRELCNICAKQNESIKDLYKYWERLNSRNVVKIGDYYIELPKSIANTTIVYEPFPDINPHLSVFAGWRVQNIVNGTLTNKHGSFIPQYASTYVYMPSYDKWNALYHDGKMVIRESTLSWKEWNEYLGLNGRNKAHIVGKIGIIKRWKEHVREWMFLNTEKWDRVDDAWVKKYQDAHKQKKQTDKESINVIFDHISSKQSLKVEDLREYNKIIVLGKGEMVQLRSVINYLKEWKGWYKCKYLVIEITPTNLHKLRYFKNLIDTDDIIKLPEFQNYFQKTKLANKLFSEFYFDFNHLKISNYYAAKHKLIKAFYIKYRKDNYDVNEFLKPLVIDESRNWTVVNDSNELRLFLEKSELLNNLSFYTPIEFYSKVVNLLHLTKINDEYRIQPKRTELQRSNRRGTKTVEENRGQGGSHEVGGISESLRCETNEEGQGGNREDYEAEGRSQESNEGEVDGTRSED